MNTRLTYNYSHTCSWYQEPRFSIRKTQQKKKKNTNKIPHHRIFPRKFSFAGLVFTLQDKNPQHLFFFNVKDSIFFLNFLSFFLAIFDVLFFLAMEFPPHSSAAFAATVPPPPATYSAAPLFPSSPTSAATNPATSGQQPSAANLFSTPLFAAGPSASYTAAAYSGLDAVSPGSTSRTPLRFPPGFLAPQPPPPLFPATSPPPSFGFHQLSASNLSNLVTITLFT